MSRSPSRAAARLAAAVRRRGVAGAARAAWRRLRGPEPLDARQRWYRLDLDDPARPRRDLDAAFTLRRGTVGDLPLLAQLPHDVAVAAVTEDLVRERLGDGHDLWIVVEGDRLAFACWVLRSRASVFGAPGGGATMPSGAVQLEDSIASPDFRGRGVAPGAWSGVADVLAGEGVQRMFTKVDVTNTASCRAVEKAGFREVAVMHLRRRGHRTRLSVEFTQGHDPGDAWLERLATG